MKNKNIAPSDRSARKRSRRINSCIVSTCIVATAALLAISLATVANIPATNAPDATQSKANTTAKEIIGQTEKTQDGAKYEPTETTEETDTFFVLTSEQRALIEQVVSAESRGEPYDGQVAVAQCILNACLKDDITPEQAIKKYKYTTARYEPTESVKEAVAAVFDRGEGITEEPILYFYNPALVESEFHESQIFVVEIANHRFFKEYDK